LSREQPQGATRPLRPDTKERPPSWETGEDGDSGEGERYPQLDAPIPSLGEAAGLSGPVVDLVARCLAMEAEERPTLHELAGALEPIAGLPASDQRHR